MTAIVHLTHFFSTTSPRILDQCDLLMDELLDREEADPSVRDAAVSADAVTGVVEVEVIAEGQDERDAEQAAVTRIRAAVASVVRLVDDESSSMQQRDVSSQLVTC